MPDFNSFDDVRKQARSSAGWFRPVKESSRIKLLSSFEILAKHWVVNRSVLCVGKEKGCPYHREGAEESKTNVSLLLWVIDREDGLVKIAELPYSVVAAINDLKKNPEYSFADGLPPYDIYITRTTVKRKDGKDGVKYTVQPSRENTSLTEAELEEYNRQKPIGEILQLMKDKLIKAYNSSDDAELPAVDVGPDAE